MSFPTYADTAPTPAPVTTGTTIQSFTDPLGDVWVAKNGVNSGNWFRARDVLHARMARNSAYNFPVTAAVLPLDYTIRDVYGLYVAASNGFVAPIPGLYLLGGKFAVTGTVTANNPQVHLYVNSGGGPVLNAVMSGIFTNVANAYHVPCSSVPYQAAANDVMMIYTLASVQLAGIASVQTSYAFCDYLGTG